MDDDNDSVIIVEERPSTRSQPSSHQTSRLPNPWLDSNNHAPISKIQPTIKCALRYFEESSLDTKMKEASLRWPFRLDPHHANRILYHDFRGEGEPPDDVGCIGDVYLDVSSAPKCVWIRSGTASKWRDSEGTGGIAWYCWKHIVHLLNPTSINDSHNPIKSIETMLNKEVGAEPRRGRQHGTISSGGGNKNRALSPNTEDESDSSSDSSNSDLDSISTSQGKSSKKLVSRYEEMKKENRTLKSEISQLKEKLPLAHAKELVKEIENMSHGH
ncbi:hypothetical protein ONZ45_g2462 [Pleurotus djamor]|nr:hypothetical protein ONZ45_g2462 [Pleurotus djamor]